MKNYISESFYLDEDKSVYMNEEICLKEKGSAVCFESSEIRLELSKIEGGIVVQDQVKIDMKDAEKQSNQYKQDRKEAYNAAGLSFSYFTELMIEDDAEGLAKFKADRSPIKLKYPKS